MREDKWHQRFLDLAEHIADWSKDPSTKVGAVIVRPNRTILSVGYNGLPRGVKDDPGLLMDRDYKYPRTVHAEMNAILNSPERPAGCSLYVWPMPPCSPCAGSIIQSGIIEVWAPRPGDRWRENCIEAMEMLTEAGVTSHWLTRRTS